MRKGIVGVLIERDGYSEEEAIGLVDLARNELYQRLEDGDMPFDICEEFFGLEPDYVEELI